MTDTDDGVESIVGANEILRCVKTLGMEIKGIRVETHERKRDKVFAEVYQPPENITATQSKCSVLKGVNVMTNGDKITCIKWNKEADLGPAVSVRLSDYGTSCADYLFLWAGVVVNSKLTFILDDKITLSGKSLKYAAKCKVRVDIREVTNKRTVELVYKAYARKGDIFNLDLVIDNADRYNFRAVIDIISNGDASDELLEPFVDRHTGLRIAEKYRSEFRALSKCTFAFNKRIDEFGVFNICYRYSVQLGIVNFDADFYSIKVKCAPSLRQILADFTNCDSGAVNRFFNYILFIDEVPDDIQEMFASLCNNANRWLIFERHEGVLSRSWR